MMNCEHEPIEPIDFKRLKQEELTGVIDILYREVGCYLIDNEGKKPNEDDRALLRNCCYALDILLDELYAKNVHVQQIEETIQEIKGWKYAGLTDNSQ